jgi:hypothetical protein
LCAPFFKAAFSGEAQALQKGASYMIGLVILGSLIALGTGGAIWGITHHVKSDFRMTTNEFLISAGVLLFLVVPLTAFLGYKAAVSHQLSYHEYYGGFEVTAYPVTYNCYESESQGGSTGGCRHYYDADSYQEWVVSESCTTDKDGKEHCVDTSHYETRWRQVPYTTTETTWIIHTTLGDFNVGDHWLPANPSAHRVRPKYGDSMDRLPGDLPSGTPQQWQQASDRIASGDPGPVTVEKDYVNYLLASQQTILHKYSPAIADYKKAGLLPDINHNEIEPYYLNRAYFVGVSVSDQAAWQWALNKFDAALGATLQGDMYVVVVDANKVTDIDQYSMALTAYWQSPQFEKYDVSKNGIILVLATKDGKTVSAARATTGMPMGNEQMLLDFQNQLKGANLDPATLFGNPKGVVSESQGKFSVTLTHTSPEGKLESIVWGEHAFQRQHMGGYTYLKGEIEPTGGETAIILVVMFVFSALAFCGGVYFGMPQFRQAIGYTSRYSR